jgi:hypothetical protein
MSLTKFSMQPTLHFRNLVCETTYKQLSSATKKGAKSFVIGGVRTIAFSLLIDIVTFFFRLFYS